MNETKYNKIISALTKLAEQEKIDINYDTPPPKKSLIIMHTYTRDLIEILTKTQCMNEME